MVTDSGNHRVVVLNTSASGQLGYVGQFGITGEARHDSSGLDTPWGIAVYAPAWESRFLPIFANVFVADRRNGRIVKLDLGYPGVWTPTLGEGLQRPNVPLPGPLDAPQLSYGGQYGPVSAGARYNETLGEPVGVALYRHFLFVADAVSNAIAVLMVDHTRTNSFRFVTRLQPAPGVRFLGSLAVSPLGYLWLSYVDLPDDYNVGSFYLPEELRYSPEPSLLGDLLGACVDGDWYSAELLDNRSLYMEHLGVALDAAGVNWRFPGRPEYFDIMSFNLSTGFNFDAFNQTVLGGTMQLCLPPPPPQSPEMMSGNEDGWNMQSIQGAAQAGAPRPRHEGARWLAALSACLWLPLRSRSWR